MFTVMHVNNTNTGNESGEKRTTVIMPKWFLVNQNTNCFYSSTFEHKTYIFMVRKG